MTAEMSNNSSDAEIRSTEHSVLATRFAHQNRVNCQTELCRFPRIFEELVGASGFEPPTPRSRTECFQEDFLSVSCSSRVVLATGRAIADKRFWGPVSRLRVGGSGAKPCASQALMA